MFEITDEMREGWAVYPKPKATPEDVDKLRAYIAETLPDLQTALSEPYIEFITNHGFVSFLPPAQSVFWYSVDSAAGTERHRGDVAYVMDVDRAITVHRNMTGEAGPSFWPVFLLPIAGSAGEDYILLELGGQNDRIFFWKEAYDPFGEGDNTRLGQVAPNMYDFINGLEPAPED
ncbi:hypothetical protein Z945_2434 [Sulfitobacter noctilucae]|uniref:SMI1/KNR4 family protein n=1 Tax=Sulfitobacter noctilucae TaxID=1342302 RepID=UPI00046A12E0|nr:SMI1/KNR4 family protein [Sulfitobacter noctilucae]KIN61442.1 hypothetical protein Z945_2434 [Sulfitobacter noctilucae]